jgi:hypothetical protein
MSYTLPAPTAAHRARSLLHRIALLERCRVTFPDDGDGLLRWSRDVAEARQELETLYLNGLDRAFRQLGTS